EPAVPRAAERQVDLWSVADLLDANGVVEHLDVDAQAIHVLQTELHVVHLAGRLVGNDVSSRALGLPPELLFGQGKRSQAAELAVDEPTLAPLFAPGRDELGAEFLVLRIQVVPRMLGLENVRI